MSFRSMSPATSPPSAALSSFPDVVKGSADVAMATGAVEGLEVASHFGQMLATRSACVHARSCCLGDLGYTSAREKVGH